MLYTALLRQHKQWKEGRNVLNVISSGIKDMTLVKLYNVFLKVPTWKISM